MVAPFRAFAELLQDQLAPIGQREMNVNRLYLRDRAAFGFAT